jgi:hypothetical protein
LLTTNPARGATTPSPLCRCTTRRARAPRRPRRMTDANSSRCVSRDATGSTGTRRSGGEPLAALATAGGDDGATGARAHPQPEPVLARPAAVVRLEGALALAHFSALLVDNRRAGARRSPSRWGKTGARHRGTLADQGTQRRRRGSNRPGTHRCLVGDASRLLACASIDRSGGIDSVRLHGPPAAHRACPRTVLRTVVDKSVDS